MNNASMTGYYLVPVAQGCPTTIPAGTPFFQGLLDVSEMADNTETEVHTTIIPAATTPGDYHVVIVTDWETVIAEENESNNIICATITVTDPGASPPANDQCSGSIQLVPATTCVNVSGTLNNATASGTAQSPCDLFSGPALLDVWYSFVATATEHDVIQSANPSFDGVIALHSSCGGAELLCADDGGTGANESIHATGLTPGNTYYIRVYDYGTIAPTDPVFGICVTAPVVTGIEDNSVGEPALFPNPTDGFFTLRVNLTEMTDVTVSVFNASGQRIHETELGMQMGGIEKDMDLRMYSAGIYLVRTRLGDRAFSQRLILVDDLNNR